MPFQYKPVLLRRRATSTSATLPPASVAVPHRSSVVPLQPVLQVVLLWAEPATGKVVPTIGGVASMVQDRLVVAPELPAASTARTSNVWEPSPIAA